MEIEGEVGAGEIEERRDENRRIEGGEEKISFARVDKYEGDARMRIKTQNENFKRDFFLSNEK